MQIQDIYLLLLLMDHPWKIPTLFHFPDHVYEFCYKLWWM